MLINETLAPRINHENKNSATSITPDARLSNSTDAHARIIGESDHVVETGERSGRGIWPALAQAGVAGVAGAVMVPLGIRVVIGALIAFGVGGIVVAAAYFALFVAVLAAVAKVAPGESWLSTNLGARVVWGLLVGGVGIVLWLLGWSVSDEAGLGVSNSPSLWIPGGFLVFALLAGMLLRRWYLALGSLTVLVVAGLFLLKSLAATLPSELERRLAAAHVSRESIMAVAVPGYHVQPNQSAWQLVPDNEDPYQPSPYASLYSLEDTPPGDCEITPHDTKYPMSDDCEIDRPGLFYVKGLSQAYVHRVDGKRIVLNAPNSVDRAVLRDAVLAVRPAEPAGSVTTTLPGYTATNVFPESTTFTPDDKTLLPGARLISVATQLSSIAGQCTYGALACEVESPALRYERFEDAHEYVRVAGSQEIRVRGGMAVGKDVLRTAVLAAHPATDDDLRLLLPASPPSTPERSPVGVVRELARALYGTR